MTLLFGAGAFVAPVMTIAFGELSYRLLERPVLRRGGARRRMPEAAPAPPAIATVAMEPTALSGEPS